MMICGYEYVRKQEPTKYSSVIFSPFKLYPNFPNVILPGLHIISIINKISKHKF